MRRRPVGPRGPELEYGDFGVERALADAHVAADSTREAGQHRQNEVGSVYEVDKVGRTRHFDRYVDGYSFRGEAVHVERRSSSDLCWNSVSDPVRLGDSRMSHSPALNWRWPWRRDCITRNRIPGASRAMRRAIGGISTLRS